MLNRFLASTAIVLSLAATPVLAQQSSSKQSDIPTNQLSLAESNVLTKSTVDDAAGNKVGNIESLVVDMKSGQVAYAILSANGKDIAVPWQRLQASDRPETFILNANKSALNNAPSVDRGTLAQLENPQERQRISSFWEGVPTQQAQTPQGKSQNESNKPQ